MLRLSTRVRFEVRALLCAGLTIAEIARRLWRSDWPKVEPRRSTSVAAWTVGADARTVTM